MATRSIPALTLIKRTFDVRLYDIDFTNLLDPAEQITSIFSITDDSGTLVFGTPLPNPAPIFYPDTGNTAQIAQAVQVQISAGVIPPGADPFTCTIRCRVVTNFNPQLEGTFSLVLSDMPP